MTISSAVASECLVDLQVAITKASATDDLLDKSITFISSAFASLSIDTIFSVNEVILLIFASKFISLISNFR
ncbi:hypothetical protein OA321_02115 [Pelagibacteraceae bacterium]|nr:hypothetical protein [Pelagibacteraceae bacterium]